MDILNFLLLFLSMYPYPSIFSFFLLDSAAEESLFLLRASPPLSQGRETPSPPRQSTYPIKYFSSPSPPYWLFPLSLWSCPFETLWYSPKHLHPKRAKFHKEILPTHLTSIFTPLFFIYSLFIHWDYLLCPPHSTPWAQVWKWASQPVDM